MCNRSNKFERSGYFYAELSGEYPRQRSPDRRNCRGKGTEDPGKHQPPDDAGTDRGPFRTTAAPTVARKREERLTGRSRKTDPKDAGKRRSGRERGACSPPHVLEAPEYWAVRPASGAPDVAPDESARIGIDESRKAAEERSTMHRPATTESGCKGSNRLYLTQEQEVASQGPPHVPTTGERAPAEAQVRTPYLYK